MVSEVKGLYLFEPYINLNLHTILGFLLFLQHHLKFIFVTLAYVPHPIWKTEVVLFVCRFKRLGAVIRQVEWQHLLFLWIFHQHFFIAGKQ